MIMMKLGRVRIVDAEINLAIRSVIVKTKFFTISWPSRALAGTPATRGIIFNYRGDVDGFTRAFNEYIKYLDSVYERSDKRLKIAITHYKKKLPEEYEHIVNTINAIKFADEADNIYRSYGRLIAALNIDYVSIKPRILTWGARATLYNIDLNLMERHGDVRVCKCKSGGRMYCAGISVERRRIECYDYVRTYIDNTDDFNEFLLGVVDAYEKSPERAESVLKDVILHFDIIKREGYTDELINDDNIALAKMYHDLARG